MNAKSGWAYFYGVHYFGLKLTSIDSPWPRSGVELLLTQLACVVAELEVNNETDLKHNFWTDLGFHGTSGQL